MSSARSMVFLGATGAVGGQALAEALRSPEVDRVTALGRRRAEVTDPPPKLTQHVVDLEDPASYGALAAGHDAAICTLGVGEPSKMKREDVWKIDVDYVVAFATACREGGVSHFSLLGSTLADAASRSYYLRMKGTVEERVKALGFRRTSLFRPSMLLTPQNRYGYSQAIVLALWPKLDWMLAGGLHKYRGIKVEDLGKAMVRNALQEGEGVEVLEWDDFRRILT